MKSAKTVAFLGVMSALVFVALFLETYVFTVLIPIAPPCFISISIAITISIYGDWKKMFIGGTILGVCSLIIAAIIGNPVFILPWISILPRIFIGIVACGVTKLVKLATDKSKNKFINSYIPYGVGAVMGVITNTVLTCFTMLMFGKVGMETVVATFMAINFPLEVVCSAILVPLLVNALHRYLRANGKIQESYEIVSTPIEQAEEDTTDVETTQEKSEE